ncbi:hypothetical protein PVK06_001696 [Gossypium arboreum]|uniref:RRM domain-containing protein n=1 Tax=Gossypium arboreum TaxID=29729 RepID=A0ABR0R1N5_GOSAR|nr:hypothetical protein PVK06_001696 [Gossypium arboreum]
MRPTYLFVNNLLDRKNWRWVRSIFGKYGKVVDVVIPKKRSRTRKKFAFLRFYFKNEVVRAMRRLNGSLILDKRIGVNLAKFGSRTTYWRRKVKSWEEVDNTTMR